MTECPMTYTPSGKQRNYVVLYMNRKGKQITSQRFLFKTHAERIAKRIRDFTDLDARVEYWPEVK